MPRKLRSRTLRQLLSSRATLLALVVVVVLIVVALLSPWIEPHNPNTQDLAAGFQGPGRHHWLGTDLFGRDLFSRLLAATRVTLLAVAQGLGVAIVLGIPVGLVAGLIGRWFDAVLSRLADALLALPPLILALSVVAMLGRGITNAMIAVGLVLAPRFFRIARNAARSVAHEGYIEASIADGCPRWRLLVFHILPNASGPLLVQASFGVGLVIQAEASLSFLGLGVQSPQASWGSMIRDAFNAINRDWVYMLPPTILVAVTTLAMFQLGDGLRDALSGTDRVL